MVSWGKGTELLNIFYINFTLQMFKQFYSPILMSYISWENGDVWTVTDNSSTYEMCVVQYRVEWFQPESIEPVGFVFAARFCDVKLMTGVWNWICILVWTINDSYDIKRFFFLEKFESSNLNTLFRILCMCKENWITKRHYGHW